MPIWMIIVEWMSRGVLMLLLGLSVWSVSIMLDRKKYYKKILHETPETNWNKHIEALSNQSISDDLLWQQAYIAISKDTTVNTIERSFETFVMQQKPKLSKGLAVLGTLGATAPFIGLFGTVLGIINAFGDLSMNSQNTNKVMFLLAEALILTAVGLLVAIPAVVAFNMFKQKMTTVLERLQAMKNTYQNIKA